MNACTHANLGDHDPAALGQTVGVHALDTLPCVIRRPQDDFADQPDALAAHAAEIDVEDRHGASPLPLFPAGAMAVVGQVWMQDPSPMQRSVLMVTVPAALRVKVGQPNSATQA